MQKIGDRPVVYSASGSHANYATAGTQEIYPIVGNIVTDTTSAGTYWDVAQNYRGYWYTPSSNTFISAGGASTGGSGQTSEGVEWLYWLGMWGDEQYPDSDERQSCSLGVSCLWADCIGIFSDVHDRLTTSAIISQAQPDPSTRILAALPFARMRMTALSRLHCD